ncbi:UNVERIFIED_ORG: hypothetical protein BCL66_1263 [Martelella mediterranea]
MAKTESLMERHLIAHLQQREQEQAFRIAALEAEMAELKKWKTAVTPALNYLSRISTPERSSPD